MARSLLSDRGIVAVTGTDAESLLNRLFTNSMLGMGDGEARYAALLSPQGKLLFDFLAVRLNDGFLLDCRRDQAGELAKRLSMFKLRAKVDVSVSAELALAALWGEEPVALPGVLAVRDPRNDALGWRLIGPSSAVASFESGEDYQKHRIALGVPEGGTDWAIGDAFVHDANLDLLHGVDFNKGCYVGQEVVSRVHHRGSARKRIVKLRFHGEPPREADVELKAGPLLLGRVTSRAHQDGLASVRIDRLQEAAESSLPVTAGDTLVEISLPALNVLTGTDEADALRL